MARILEASFGNIAEAARALRAGALVAFPTETVYGLGGDARSDPAVAAIFAAKSRPSFNPLIVHIPKASAARQFAHWPPEAEILAREFWPGPLTLVLPRLRGCKISLLASAGLDSVALRVPRHKVARTLLMMTGLPLAAPSANPSGRLSPTRAEHVAQGLGEHVDMILDGGPCEIGLESTVVSLVESQARVLRLGAITTAEIGEALQADINVENEDDIDKPRSPGRSLLHYAPERPLRIEAGTALPGEAFLGFGPDCREVTLNLSPTGNPQEAAANLFAMLRALDDAKYCGIAVAPIPDAGLGSAINDRLRRAARRPKRSCP